jgi:uncharacterized protein YkwD
MKRSEIALLILVLQSIPLISQDRSLKKVAQLNQVIQESKRDSLLLFERECALEFHQIINSYRKANKEKLLKWNDSLWLAARNHSDYLIHNNEFSHQQINSKALFSGKTPSNRALFANPKSLNRYNCGENLVLGNIHGWDAIAVAKQAFEIWKKSPGHNDNMLNEDYSEHGAAIRIVVSEHVNNSAQYIFTDLFAIVEKQKEPLAFAQNTMVSEANAAYENNKAVKPSETPLNTRKVKMDLGNAFYYTKVQDFVGQSSRRNAELSKKAEKYGTSFLSTFVKNRELMKEMKRQNWYTYTDSEAVPGNLFQRLSGRFKNTVTTSIVCFKPNYYKLDEIAQFIFQSWNEQLTPQAKSFGYHIAIKRKGEHFIVCASLEQAA